GGGAHLRPRLRRCHCSPPCRRHSPWRPPRQDRPLLIRQRPCPPSRRRDRPRRRMARGRSMKMIPGEIIPAEGEIILNEGKEAITLRVANRGDRPVQVGSHYHFYETNEALDFDRESARGIRLDIAASTAIRFEPGQAREVRLVPVGGERRIFGFNGKVMGQL